jgi:hypothetical protein
MKKTLLSIAALLIAVFFAAGSGLCQPSAQLASTEYKAGDTVTISGTIEPGEDLYVTIASQHQFAPQDTDGVNERRTF